jgi:hypothetical protein
VCESYDISLERISVDWLLSFGIAYLTRYRSIWFSRANGIVDSVLLEAGRETNVDVRNRFSADVMMWVDPNCVRIQYGATGKNQLLYEGQERSPAKVPLEICRPFDRLGIVDPAVFANKLRN